MDITSIRDFFEFTKENKMSCNEQILYFHLFMIANENFWPDTIKVSTAQLMKFTGASKHTVLKSRQKLKDLGLIDFCLDGYGAGAKTEYKLTEFSNKKGANQYHLEEEKGCKLVPLKSERVQISTTKGCNIVPLKGAKENHLTPGEANNDRPSETPKTYKTIKHDHSSLESSIISAHTREGGGITETDGWEKVRTEYENSIHPVCSLFEAEKLQDDIERYGAETVIKAIQRAVTRNARSLAYIEGILQSWKRKGFDDGQTRRNAGAVSPETQRYLEQNAELLREWFDGS